MIAVKSGLGYVLWDAYYVGRMDICVATMFSVGLLGFLSDQVIVGIGRLVLRIAGYRDGALDRPSDALCTALQLTNFWQDFGRDWIAECRNAFLIRAPEEDLFR